MEKNRTTTFSVYLTIILFLISTFITMVITESNIIRVPEFQCPNGYRKDANGKCREVFHG
uniref:U17-myrmicitoxin-Tb1f n=1 Tax=Tetramorium bicarinatum TaxID=219812 RepID=TX17F_TETBN|nr:RecName: Full=U17-myrmicitoxin-Tb1f; Short=U17-MYRTX-Tb1f; Flags: Precursor [Tetramorium bicarinatum]QJZ31629.1 U17-MYRTX-Tb1f precursor [Tetramorium bicarinatum]